MNKRIFIFKYYKPLTVEYLNENVYIDIEKDYNILVTKNSMTVRVFIPSTNQYETQTHEMFYITAELKSGDLRNIYEPEEIESRNVNYAYNTYYKDILPLIVTKLVPTINKAKIFIEDINNNLGKIIVEEMKKHYKMFDITLKDLPDDNEEKLKFWLKDKFIMDGYASIKAGNITITIDVVNGVPIYYPEIKDFPNKKKNQTLKHIINMCILPGNFLIKYIQYMENLIDIMIVGEILFDLFLDYYDVVNFC